MSTIFVIDKERLARSIVCCIQEAVENDIRSDVQGNNLVTTNSVPTRIWDLLNRNVHRDLNVEDCTVAQAHRGPWQMLVLFDKDSKNIITFMRENRFAQLQKSQHKRSKMHYVNILTKQFNSDLLADTEQLCCLPPVFSDEERLPELVQTLLADLHGLDKIVRHHIIVLFETAGYHLTRVRAVMVTSSLEIAQNGEQDLSMYISSSTNAVVEKVYNPDSPANQPSRGLTLKTKALERKKNKLRPKAHELDYEAES